VLEYSIHDRHAGRGVTDCIPFGDEGDELELVQRGSFSGQLSGWSSSGGFGAMRFGCVFALYRLHHRRRSGFRFLHLDGQVTQNGIIEFECGFQLNQGLVVASMFRQM
jgi:hypothetical protein